MPITDASKANDTASDKITLVSMLFNPQEIRADTGETFRGAKVDNDRSAKGLTSGQLAKAFDRRARTQVRVVQDRADLTLGLRAITPGGVHLYEALGPLDRFFL